MHTILKLLVLTFIMILELLKRSDHSILKLWCLHYVMTWEQGSPNKDETMNFMQPYIFSVVF